MQFQQTTAIFALTVLLMGSTINVVNSAMSEECRQQTKTLREDDALSAAFDELLKEYKEDAKDICDFSSENIIDCGLDFTSENETFHGVCQEAGGQIVDRNVGLHCSLARVASFDVGVGKIPICIGTSCNATAFDPRSDMNDTQVDDFLDDLSFSDCKATMSAGTRSVGITVFGVIGTIVAAISFLVI